MNAIYRPTPLLAQMSAAESLARIAEVEPAVHAWVATTPDAGTSTDGTPAERTPGAAAAGTDAAGTVASGNDTSGTAQTAAAQSPLAGVPVGVKDIIDVAGFPTRCGSPATTSATPKTSSAAIVDLLTAAGAHPMGKTVTTEYAYFQPGPTDNPAAPGHTPGGSSSGSAAAVASGMVPLALGTQTAGSLTRPAAYCGITGFVAPTSWFDTAGIAGLAPTLDAIGFLTADVASIATVCSELSQRAGHQLAPSATPLITVWHPGAEFEVADDMQAALTRAEAVLQAAGLQVQHGDLDAQFSALAQAHMTIMAREAAETFRMAGTAQAALSQPLRELLATGAAVSDADYQGAHEVRRRGLESSLWHGGAHHNLVLCPAAQGAPPRGLAATGSPLLSRPAQLLGLPTLTVAGARNAADQPLGLQLCGTAESIATMFEVGAALEAGLSSRG